MMAIYGVWPLGACPLPEAISVAGETIDHLFYGIHTLALVILLGTGGAIGWVIWKFDHRRNDNANAKAAYFHHNTKAGSDLDAGASRDSGDAGVLSDEFLGRK